MKFSSFVLSALFTAGALAMPAATPTASAPKATESLGWAQHWIKSTDDLFLQAATPWTPGDAVLGSPLTAGEFNIVSTSLVDTVHTPTFLVAAVDPITPGATKLKLSFQEGLVGPDGSGEFAWSGAGKSLVWDRADSTFTGWITCDSVVYANLKSTIPAGCTSVNIASYVATYSTD